MFKKLLVTSVLLISSYFMVSNDVQGKSLEVDTNQYNYFTDVAPSNVHSADIYTLYRMGGINGYGNELYGINDSVQRQHIVAIMYRLLKDDAKIIRPEKQFKDVPKTHTFYKEITWGYQIGMIDGDGEKFKPADSMNREQMAKILTTAFDFKANNSYTFKDVEKTNWAYPYVNVLYDNEITRLSNFTYNPKQNVTRGQLASFIIRSLQKEEKYNIGIEFVREVPGSKPQQPTQPTQPQNPIEEKPKEEQPTNNYANLPKFVSGYGFDWYAEVGQKTLHLHGLDSKGNVIANYVKGEGKSLEGVKIGDSKATVESNFKNYKIDALTYKDGKYSLKNIEKSIYVIKKNGIVTHIFLDNHQNDKVVGILSMSESVYASKSYYGNEAKADLQKGYETMMNLLINQSRKEHNLPTLADKNSEYISLARNHSIDMATNNYFSHTSPTGSSMKSRFAAYNIPRLKSYGENLAYGQESVIHAHEGLMNSLGHRENILEKGYEYSITGVAFNNNGTPYFTINFYSTFK